MSEIVDFAKTRDIVYEACCNRIATDAVKRLSADNVTVMIIPIDAI